MKRLVLTLICCVGAAFPAHAQVVNAANYRIPGMAGAGVAQGSIFVVFGSFIGPSTLVQATSLPLKATLSDTSISVTVGSVTTNAYIVYTSYSQVAAVLPSNTPVGNGSLFLKYVGRRSNPIAITVVQNSFGTFSMNQAGYGPGIIQNYDSSGNPSTNALNNSAQPGQTAVIWGTGLGPISGDDSNTPPSGNFNAKLSVFIGGQQATVSYQGRSSFPGVDQINFQVPSGVTGCYVPVEVNTAGVVGNFTSMAIASSGGTCSDTVSFAAQDINTAVQKGQSNIGLVSITDVSSGAATGQVQYRINIGEAEFRRSTLASFLTSRGVNYPASALGTCTAVTFQLNPNNTDVLDPGNPSPTTFLNAGAAIQYNGPAGSRQINRQSAGNYAGIIGGGLPGNTALPVFVTPGSFSTIGGRLGVDVDSFQTSLQLPDGLTWTNMSTSGSVSRSTDLQLTWSGGDPTQDVALVLGESTDSTGTIRGVFTCMQDLSTGTLTVPADVLSTLPASTSGLLEVGTLTRSDVARFTPQNSVLDAAYFQIERTARIPATYQ